jgi:hypothetical protein
MGIKIMESKRILAVLIVFGALNLALTMWLVIDLHMPTHLSGSAIKNSPLPAELSASKRDALFDQIKNLFNTQDYDRLYGNFSREVQVQIPFAEFKTTMEKLKATFGDIEDGTYSYYEFVENQNGKNFYSLFYIVRLPKSSISPKGALKVTVIDVDGKVNLYGIYLSGVTQ